MLMQVDFYQLTRDPAEKILPALATKIIADGGRLLVVSSDSAQLNQLSARLWGHKADSFLAHAISDASSDLDTKEHDAVQPILLSNTPDAVNGARFIVLTDGEWRDEALSFDRAFYLFPPERTDDARTAWRKLGEREDVTRNYWRQDGGRWVQGP
jgi:DNA polymerase III subunit chi